MTMNGLGMGAWALGFAAAFVIGVAPTAQAPDDAAGLRAALDAYLVAYQPQLSGLAADEQMVQRDQSMAAFNTGRARVRTITAQVAFAPLPGGAGWLGFRRVLSVNRAAIKDPGPSLADLADDPNPDDVDQAFLLAAESTRHNMGAIRINLPLVPLEMLHARNRARFTARVDGPEREGGAATVRLVFEETGRPTLVQREGGGDMPSRITAWVEPGSGRLHRARVVSHDERPGRAGPDAVLDVRFKANTALGLLVPAEMNEEFGTSPGRKGVGKATYTNYRKIAEP